MIGFVIVTDGAWLSSSTIVITALAGEPTTYSARLKSVRMTVSDGSAIASSITKIVKLVEAEPPANVTGLAGAK